MTNIREIVATFESLSGFVALSASSIATANKMYAFYMTSRRPQAIDRASEVTL